ncbi:cell wall hydrolase [Sphingomonas parva]|uniref:Cell wall hydrolase n=1 Tax=Sphingomonas parva TaxID=2555898 RepID=A0A4Y8ZQ01_9SPHN|nr:cell wall hydrolase [Sphingomonas parva]TFI57352.1 cell wall hydrolase [Sphingomonas parva]
MLLSTAALPELVLPVSPKRNWPAVLLLALTFLLYLLAAFSLAGLQPAREIARGDARGGRIVVPGLGTPPQPEPMRFRDVAPEDAKAINAAVPISDLPNPAARAFKARFSSDLDRLRATECLTAAIYYEAATEPLDGQRAVAQVVLNRVRHPAYPRSVCGVVFQGSERATGCQFTFTCDGAIRRTPMASLWARARQVAEEALAGKVYAPVGWATHYHTNWVVPYWSSSLTKLANVGTHIFYRWEGGWGRPPAFRFQATGLEPQIALMRHLTSDPASLADAEELSVDQAAALAAAEAAAAGTATLPPGVVPASAPGSLTSDIKNRPVIRRYEPMTREAATDAALARSKEPAPASLHWALSGLPSSGAKPATPLGKKAEGEPAPPKCLEGIRKLPAAGEGQAQAQAC